MLIKQVSRGVKFVVDTLSDMMKGFSINVKIFHVTPPLVDDQIRMDKRFLLSNFDLTINS